MEGAAGEDTRVAEIRATSATALDAKVVPILARALGQRRIGVGDSTYLDGPDPICGLERRHGLCSSLLFLSRLTLIICSRKL